MIASGSLCTKTLSPFLKWAGGKRWLCDRYPELFPDDFDRYVEPFLGGGAVYFALSPRSAFLTDANPELINAYLVARDHPLELAQELEVHQRQHSKSHYYSVRDLMHESRIDRAARFIYLNRACWNGLYRVNLEGVFNVPIGTKNQIFVGLDEFLPLSIQLQSAEIWQGDFECSISRADEGDFVFVDPPYTTAHNFNGFVKYNEAIFNWNDQKRLREAVCLAGRRGARLLITNAAHECIHDLYKGIGRHDVVKRSSVISGVNSGRGVTSELAIRVGY
jgi:DNA adenine methylase